MIDRDLDTALSYLYNSYPPTPSTPVIYNVSYLHTQSCYSANSQSWGHYIAPYRHVHLKDLPLGCTQNLVHILY